MVSFKLLNERKFITFYPKLIVIYRQSKEETSEREKVDHTTFFSAMLVGCLLEDFRSAFRTCNFLNLYLAASFLARKNLILLLVLKYISYILGINTWLQFIPPLSLMACASCFWKIKDSKTQCWFSKLFCATRWWNWGSISGLLSYHMYFRNFWEGVLVS